MTFTIAEDIKTLLSNNLTFDESTAIANYGGFESGLTGWSTTAVSVDETVPQEGLKCIKIESIGGKVTTDTFAIPQITISEVSFYLRFASGSTSAVMTIEITYSDSSTSEVAYTFASADTWVQKDFTSSLDKGKVITKIAFNLTGASETLFIDNVVLTFDETIKPNIRLLDDDRPIPYDSNGDVIIGREQLLRIDQYNGIRSETFLVDIDLVYDDQSASAPTNIKLIMARLDKIFDAENINHTAYYYKPRYDWLGSYRIGVTKFQLEVLNALVTRPGLT